MNFAAVPSGTAVFLDSNVFVYAFAADPQFGRPCTELLKRVETRDVDGLISASVLHDVAHRLMTLEACDTFGWPYAGIGRRMRRHPAELQQLRRFRQAMDEIVAIPVQVLPVTLQHVLLAGDLSRTHGLLSGDALILAMMQSNGLTQLASNDADFDRVPAITRFSPM